LLEILKCFYFFDGENPTVIIFEKAIERRKDFLYKKGAVIFGLLPKSA
jgi:hypothetical protein